MDVAALIERTVEREAAFGARRAQGAGCEDQHALSAKLLPINAMRAAVDGSAPVKIAQMRQQILDIKSGKMKGDAVAVQERIDAYEAALANVPEGDKAKLLAGIEAEMKAAAHAAKGDRRPARTEASEALEQDLDELRRELSDLDSAQIEAVLVGLRSRRRALKLLLDYATRELAERKLAEEIAEKAKLARLSPAARQRLAERVQRVQRITPGHIESEEKVRS